MRELRDELGTDPMHDLEAQALLRALADTGPDIVGAAASVVDREDCRSALRGDGVAVAWLTVSPATEAKRFTSGTHRPWYGDDPRAFLARQARERDPSFRSLDPVIVATDDREPGRRRRDPRGLGARGIELGLSAPAVLPRATRVARTSEPD